MEVGTAPPASDAWGAEFEKLRSRFPKAQDRVLFCIHALQQDNDIHLDDLKALANLHGLHVTGTSLNAARRLLTLGTTSSRRSRRVPRHVDQSDRRAEPDTTWPDARENLHALFPKTREGILYAVYRLQHDASLRLPDIRDDAEAAGIKVGGRSLHSARALLASGGHRAPVAPIAKREHRTQDIGSMPANGWAATREALAVEFPNAREGILYAIFRLRQDSNLRLPDLRADAEAAGIKFGGRSLHSARALLAGQDLTNGRSHARPNSRTGRPPARSDLVNRLLGDESPEEQIRQLVARIEGDMRKEVDRMRDAIRAAVRILSEALT